MDYQSSGVSSCTLRVQTPATDSAWSSSNSPLPPKRHYHHCCAYKHCIEKEPVALNESLCGVGSTVAHSTPMSECKQGGAEDTTDEETVIMAERKNDVPENSWRSNSSEPEWITTTDTSIHSSLSTTRSVDALDVPIEVLEACDGMDDANHYPTSEVRLGKGKVIGRTVARNNRKVERKESSASDSSSSGDSGSASSSYDTASSSSPTSSSSCSSRSTDSDSSSSCSHSSSCSCSHASSCSCSHASSCSCSHASSCSCSHASSCSDLSSSCSDHSSTSFQSTDDLTELPRAKTKSRRLGKMACKKVADKCNQS